MQYDKNRFKVCSLPHPIVLFWVLFPGTMFFELMLGLRLPKVVLVDKESDKPQIERSYIPCPHCETLNDRRLWAIGNGNTFGHWFGLVCPSCHQIIPCLWNIFSLAVLAITFPLWYFLARFFRPRWLEIEKKRLASVLEGPLTQARDDINWFLRSIFFFGGLVWVILEIIPQVWKVLNGGEWDLIMMFIAFPIWLFPGFVCSLLWMPRWMNRKGKKADGHESD